MMQMFVLCGVVLSLHLCTAAPLQDNSGAWEWSSGWSFHHVLGSVLPVAVLVCLIKVLTMCAEFCQKRQPFQEFEDTDNVFNPDLNPISPIAPEFSMVPPTENTPDAVAASSPSPIVFDPLPDLSLIKQPQLPQVANAVQLRPKVAVIPQDDSEDFDDVIMRHDPSQDKPKLHNVLANSKSQVPREQVSYIKELGSGWFGKVLQGEGHNILPGHKKTKIVVQMLKEDADVSEQLAFLMEATPYRDVDHRNVLKLLGQCVDTSPYLTVLEFCPFGDLKSYLRSHRVAMESFNEKGLLLKFASDMAAGLQALHEVNFVHRDFAARNCLLSSDLTVKIGDYGLGEENFKEDYLFDRGGCGLPIRWLAPECMVLQENGEVGLRGITVKCNVWSFGVSLWEVITFGNLPYGDLSNEHVLRLVVKEKSLTLSQPDVHVTHLERLFELMQLCWSPPATRPSLRELRIMLLHLLSHKITTHNTEAFEQKWNKLLPRRQPQVVKAGPDSTVSDPSTGNHLLSNGAIKTVTTNDIGAVPYSEPSRRDLSLNMKSTDSDGFARLDASALENAEPHDGLSLEEELALVHRSQPIGGGDLTSPVNELSLAAELSDLHGGNHSEEVTPVNEKSIEEELLASKSDSFVEVKPIDIVPERKDEAKISSSFVSDTVGLDQDDILIFDNNGMQVQGENSEETSEEKTEIVDISDPEPVVVKVTDMDRLREEAQSATPSKSESILAQARGSGTMATPAKDISQFTSPPDGSHAFSSMVTTSTPKKGETDDVFSLHTPIDALSELQGNSEYYTALSAQISVDSGASSTPSLPSTSTDDRSFLGEKKFAAMLQTVVTSFDNEEDLMSASLGEMSFEAIPEELVFADDRDRDLNATPTGDSMDLLAQIPEEMEKQAEDETFTMDLGHGDANSSSDPFDNSRAGLLPLDDSVKKEPKESDVPEGSDIFLDLEVSGKKDQKEDDVPKGQDFLLDQEVSGNEDRKEDDGPKGPDFLLDQEASGKNGQKGDFVPEGPDFLLDLEVSGKNGKETDVAKGQSFLLDFESPTKTEEMDDGALKGQDFLLDLGDSGNKGQAEVLDSSKAFLLDLEDSGQKEQKDDGAHTSKAFLLDSEDSGKKEQAGNGVS